MGHHHARDAAGKIGVAELVKVEEVRLNFVDQAGEKRRGLAEVLRGLVHPLQAKRRGPVLEAVEKIHPGGLVGQGNLAESDECDANAARD